MRLATLGPAGTFSELAAQAYLVGKGDGEILHYNHIQRCLAAVPDECSHAVVPLENVSEGFVPVVLDYLVHADMYICDEIHLDIAFSLVANTPDLSAVDAVFVQFVARGQCREFIDGLGDIELVATQSNSESLQRLLSESKPAAAVVPSHVCTPELSENVALVQHHIHDYAHNQTRFIVVASGKPSEKSQNGAKTSLMVINHDDRPGLLEQVLHCFSTRRLNLTSIVSRPTGEAFGRYHFFMDVQSPLNNIAMQGALQAVERLAKVKVLGCY